MGRQGGIRQQGDGQTPVISDAPAAAPLKPGSSFVADAVAKVGPAVVRIDTRRQVVNPMGMFGGGLRCSNRARVLDSSPAPMVCCSPCPCGGRAGTVTVTLPDGRSFPGKVLGADTLTDVAVVAMAQGLPVAPLANSADVRPGQWAIAIGNPWARQHGDDGNRECDCPPQRPGRRAAGGLHPDRCCCESRQQRWPAD